MRATGHLSRWLSEGHAFSHRLRVAALAFAVRSLLDGGVLTLTSLGRSRSGRVAPKHRIKRIDRLLGNPHLQSEVADYCRWLADDLLGNTKRPTVLVDWTPLTGPAYACVAAFVVDGRALPIFWKVHHRRHSHSRGVQRRFLRELGGVLPKGCKPIIVTDAGFYTFWFQEVRRLGWDYVGRVRGKTGCRESGGEWLPTTRFFSEAKLSARDLGSHEISRSHPLQSRLVLVRGRRKPGPKRHRDQQRRKPGPQNKSHPRKGLSATEANSRYRKSAEEPWLLATSLAEEPGWVVSHYRARMQIEETFRQLKTERFGWALDRARTKSARRWNVLLLIGAIAAAFCTRLGRAAEAAGLHLRYQANTTRHRRTLALITLGNLVANDRYCPTTPHPMRGPLLEVL